MHKAVASKYIYVTDRTQSELLVYPAGVQNPSPIRTVTQNLTQVGGVAVDSSGDVYVANSPPNGGTSTPAVIEYSSGATSIIRTFTQGLNHPVNVTIGSNGTVYVADHNGANSAIVEYAPTGGAPIATILIPNEGHDFPRGVAVDASGDIFLSVSGINDAYWPPPQPLCVAISWVYEYPAGGSGWTSLGHIGLQPWGLALDSNDVLYLSDYCENSILTLNPPSYAPPTGSVSGTFNKPVYATVSSDDLLAVPNADNGTSGSATVIHLTSILPPVTITTGLEGPIGAAAGP